MLYFILHLFGHNSILGRIPPCGKHQSTLFRRRRWMFLWTNLPRIKYKLQKENNNKFLLMKCNYLLNMTQKVPRSANQSWMSFPFPLDALVEVVRHIHTRKLINFSLSTRKNIPNRFVSAMPASAIILPISTNFLLQWFSHAIPASKAWRKCKSTSLHYCKTHCSFPPPPPPHMYVGMLVCCVWF